METTADNIGVALADAGFSVESMGLSLTGTATQFIVTFGGVEPVMQYVDAGSLPSTVAFAQANAVNAVNADLLPYFDPFPHLNAEGVTVAGETLNGATSTSLLGQPSLSSGALQLTTGNYNVDTVIDQVLFNAEYPPLGSTGLAAIPATQEQLGRLRSILEDAAGLLRGDSNGVMASFWDAAAQYNHSSTYSDDIVNTHAPARTSATTSRSPTPSSMARSACN